MEHTKQQQAERLFFQTDLNRAEISEMVGISRTTLNDWIAENEWERIKKNTRNLPVMLSENCFQMLGNIQRRIFEKNEEGIPTKEEVRMIASLQRSANGITRHSTLNATIEFRLHFLDWINDFCPDLATSMQPLLDGFIKSQAKLKPEDLTSGRALTKADYFPRNIDTKELSLDIPDYLYWKENPHEAPISMPHNHTNTPSPAEASAKEGPNPNPNSQFSIPNSKEANPNSQLPIPSSQSSNPNSKFPIPNSPSPVIASAKEGQGTNPNSQSPIPNSPSSAIASASAGQIPNSQEANPNSKSPIPNSQDSNPNSKFPIPNSNKNIPNSHETNSQNISSLTDEQLDDLIEQQIDNLTQEELQQILVRKLAEFAPSALPPMSTAQKQMLGIKTTGLNKKSPHFLSTKNINPHKNKKLHETAA